MLAGLSRDLRSLEAPDYSAAREDDRAPSIMTCIEIHVIITAERPGAFDNPAGNIKCNASWKTQSCWPVLSVDQWGAASRPC